MCDTKPLYKPFKYKGTGKFKYSVYVKSRTNKCGKKLVHFGHVDYQQYFDKGKHFTHLNHKDLARRANYRKRARGIRNKRGQRTYKLKDTKNYWAYQYLW